DLPPVICDHSQLNQVFLNILNNAVDAIQSQLQSAQDKTKTAEIQIYTDTIENNQIEIIIANTGEPIDPTIQEKIFDPFFTTKTIGQGSGLGLFVCYSVIEQHQGNIVARSQIGEKTEFVITLPVQASGKST
ncbi:MAG: ATP-binding protein, partial [Cyanobacteria bacterium J06650_10]